MQTTLERLQDWYSSNCDDDWEHQYGIEIGTLDNPGWALKVDLNGASLEEVPLPEVKDRYEHETEWLRCWKDGPTFHCACGPHRLEDAMRS